MESESSQYLSPWSSSSTPPQVPIESFIGSFVSMISNYDLRYEGFIYYLNLQDSTLGLRNVICYGTEERTKNGFQIHPFNIVYDYILFRGTDIKEILVKPRMSYTHCGFNGGYYGCLAREATLSKPPLPLMVSACNPNGANIRQKFPENLIKPQATTDSNAYSDMGSVNDRFYIPSNPIAQYASNPIAQPQFPGSYYYDAYAYNSMLNQARIDVASSPNPSQSFFTTFPPPPVSIPQINGRVDFEAMNKNFNQYELWGPPENKEEESPKPAYNIDGSFYKISRKPFEPIGKPYNPFGPIARPVKHTEEISTSLQRRLQLQPPPYSFTSGYNRPF